MEAERAYDLGETIPRVGAIRKRHYTSLSYLLCAGPHTHLNARPAQLSTTARPIQPPPTPTGWHRGYSRWLAATDTLAVLTAVGIAQWIRFGSTTEGAAVTGLRGITYLQISVCITLVWLAALTVNHSRSQRVIGSGVEEYRRVWWATITTFGAVAIASMLFKLEIARGYLMVALPIGIALLFLSRWFARKIIIRLRRSFGKMHHPTARRW